MTRLLSIDADLSTPPSSPSVYRDITLVASIRCYEVVAVTPLDMRDLYWRWFRHYGLLDYVEDLLTPEEAAHENALVQIVGGKNARLTAHNLGAVVAFL